MANQQESHMILILLMCAEPRAPQSNSANSKVFFELLAGPEIQWKFHQYGLMYVYISIFIYYI